MCFNVTSCRKRVKCSKRKARRMTSTTYARHIFWKREKWEKGIIISFKAYIVKHLLSKCGISFKSYFGNIDLAPNQFWFLSAAYVANVASLPCDLPVLLWTLSFLWSWSYNVSSCWIYIIIFGIRNCWLMGEENLRTNFHRLEIWE